MFSKVREVSYLVCKSLHLDLCARCSGTDSDTIRCVIAAGITLFQGNILLQYAHHRKTEWFGSVINGKMHLSEIGLIASQLWYEIPVHFPFIDLDAFVVMPNHIHGVIIIIRFSRKPMVGALHATPGTIMNVQKPGTYAYIREPHDYSQNRKL